MHDNCYMKYKHPFMKAIKQLLAITGSAIIIASCQNNNDQHKIESDSDTQTTDQRSADHAMSSESSNKKYVDLKTGQSVELYYDANKKMTYSTVNDEPVDLYVNVATGDTIYGRGRYVVNNYVTKTGEGTYKLDEGKVKITKDGIKIKDGDKKFKIEDGDMKIKDGDNKYKIDNDEEKMKTDSEKSKTDNGETKTKNQ